MKTRRENISGKAVLLDCFSTPWESTELLTIYLSNLWNETTLGNCQNIINTNSSKRQGALSNASRGCSPQKQLRPPRLGLAP